MKERPAPARTKLAVSRNLMCATAETLRLSSAFSYRNFDRLRLDVVIATLIAEDTAERPLSSGTQTQDSSSRP